MGTLKSQPAWHLEVDLLPFGVCLLDATGHIVDVNQVELDLLGYPRHDVIGRRFDVFQADPAKGEQLLARLLDGEALTRELVERRNRRGDVLSVVIDAHPSLEAGKLRGVRCFTRDVSEERRAERARSERAAVDVAETVQRRIGHDLHDGLAQVLVGAALIAHRVGERAPADLVEDAARLREILNEAAARVESIARGLSPLRVTGLGVAQALSLLAKEVSATLGVEVDVVVDAAADRQPEATTQQIGLIAQEAVRNAWRHGRASRVQIRLQSTGAGFVLSIEDDGIGIRPDAPTRGVGLESMRARAQAIGGSLLVTGVASGGTLVRCAWGAGRASSEHPVMA